MRTLLKYALRGAVILVPAAAAAYVISLPPTTIDGMPRLPVPGLGIAVTVALVTLFGLSKATETLAPVSLRRP